MLGETFVSDDITTNCVIPVFVVSQLTPHNHFHMSELFH